MRVVAGVGAGLFEGVPAWRKSRASALSWSIDGEAGSYRGAGRVRYPRPEGVRRLRDRRCGNAARRDRRR